MTLRHRAWLVALVLLALAPMVAGAAHLKEQPRKHKVVYHLTDAGVDKAKFVLGNLPALKTFVTASIDPEIMAKLDRLQTQLPPGARYLPQGGVVRVMELVEQGYVYIRP